MICFFKHLINLIRLIFINIGKILGKKDHTTVMHGVTKITEELKINEELSNKVEVIKKKINPA